MYVVFGEHLSMNNFTSASLFSTTHTLKAWKYTAFCTVPGISCAHLHLPCLLHSLSLPLSALMTSLRTHMLLLSAWQNTCIVMHVLPSHEFVWQATGRDVLCVGYAVVALCAVVTLCLLIYYYTCMYYQCLKNALSALCICPTVQRRTFFLLAPAFLENTVLHQGRRDSWHPGKTLPSHTCLCSSFASPSSFCVCLLRCHATSCITSMHNIYKRCHTPHMGRRIMMYYAGRTYFSCCCTAKNDILTLVTYTRGRLTISFFFLCA